MSSLDGIPYLDVVRPAAGWSTELVVVATYSVDLVAAGATLVAAAGLGDDAGKGTRIDFATALEELRGRFRILSQKGRVAAPPENLPILTVLDQFIVEQDRDERVDSWHPKVALVRHTNDESGEARWRLWVGSRNLTRGTNWELGLVVESGSDGVRIPGVEELMSELLERSSLDVARFDFGQLRWRVPEGIVPGEVQLWTSGVGPRWPSPDAHDRTVIISPFVDAAFLERAASWPSEHRVLVSSLPQLLELSPDSLAPYDVFFLDEPVYDLESEEQTEESEEERLPIGLHAKCVAALQSDGGAIWMGSANATRRGWEARNSEVIARLDVSQAVVDGLRDFLALARPFRPDEAPELPEPGPREALEAMRNELAASWTVAAGWSEGTLTLRRGRPFLSDERVDVFVTPVGLKRWKLWPYAQDTIRFEPVKLARVTELVRVRAELDGERLEWVMVAPLDARPDAERDRSAVAELLDVRAYLAWIRALLHGGWETDADTAWDRPTAGARSSAVTRIEWAMPALEDILQTWARDPQRLRFVDERLRYYSKHMEEFSERWSTRERKLFEEFQRVWATVAEVLT